MKLENIKTARKLAQEFINTVDDMITIEASPESTCTYTIGDVQHSYQSESPKHRGAVRRKSMDLTRALAEMRKP